MPTIASFDFSFESSAPRGFFLELINVDYHFYTPSVLSQFAILHSSCSVYFPSHSGDRAAMHMSYRTSGRPHPRFAETHAMMTRRAVAAARSRSSVLSPACPRASQAWRPFGQVPPTALRRLCVSASSADSANTPLRRGCHHPSLIMAPDSAIAVFPQLELRRLVDLVGCMRGGRGRRVPRSRSRRPRHRPQG